MSKEELRGETERLIREAMARGSVTVTKGKTRIDAVCGKCGAANKVMAAPGQTRVAYTCKDCNQAQHTM